MGCRHICEAFAGEWYVDIESKPPIKSTERESMPLDWWHCENAENICKTGKYVSVWEKETAFV